MCLYHYHVLYFDKLLTCELYINIYTSVITFVKLSSTGAKFSLSTTIACITLSSNEIHCYYSICTRTYYIYGYIIRLDMKKLYYYAYIHNNKKFWIIGAIEHLIGMFYIEQISFLWANCLKRTKLGRRNNTFYICVKWGLAFLLNLYTI